MDLIVKLVADGLVIPVVLIGAYALLKFVPNSDKYRVYTYVLMAGLTSYTIAKIIGSLYQPSLQRPFEVLGVDAGASFLNNPGFPSDHALFTMAITLAVLFAARQRKLGLIALVLTILVCAGRVIALVHTPLDVVGGVVIACMGAVWYIPLRKKPAKRVK